MTVVVSFSVKNKLVGGRGVNVINPANTSMRGWRVYCCSSAFYLNQLAVFPHYLSPSHLIVNSSSSNLMISVRVQVRANCTSSCANWASHSRRVYL